MIIHSMMLTDYNSGRWRCVRTASRRERESQKVKKGADPRRKSKLKVCRHFFIRLPILKELQTFLSPSICKICRSWLLWRIRCPPCAFLAVSANSYLSVCNGLKFSVLDRAKKKMEQNLLLSIHFLCFDACSSLPRPKYPQIDFFLMLDWPI